MPFCIPFPTWLARPLAVVALGAGATPALAQMPGAISLTQVTPSALRLRIDNPTCLAGSVQVVRLGSGQTLFTESYAVPWYGHHFDFSHVPSGRYLVRLRVGGIMHRCLVRVQTRSQGSAIRRIKLTSPETAAFVVVKSWRAAAGSGAVAAAPGSTDLTQGPQKDF